MSELNKILTSRTVSPTVYDPNYPDNVLPDEMDTGWSDGGEYTIQVGVIIDEEHFSGYYEPKIGKWWVNYGGFTIGHMQTDNDEIQGWYYIV